MVLQTDDDVTIICPIKYGRISILQQQCQKNIKINLYKINKKVLNFITINKNVIIYLKTVFWHHV